MTTPRPDVTAALASLQARWGGAAPRRIGEVVGSLATVPLPGEAGAEAAFPATLPLPAPTPVPAIPGRPASGRRPDEGRIVSTGFDALDAIIGPGGLPRETAVSVRGDGTSGKTTLALRLAAEAQAAGSIVAYLDLARSLDPVEAVARGVRLEWLVVLTPRSIDDGLAMAGALVGGRAIDLLLVDLPGPGSDGWVDRDRSAGAARPGAAPGRAAARDPTVAERLHRLAALARRAGTTLVVLEPPGLPSGLRRALEGSTGLRLELERRSWIRLGRDVVGQRTEAVVARNRFGPPGRRVELRILYAEGGERDACLRRDPLLGPDGSGPGDVLRKAAIRGRVAAPDGRSSDAPAPPRTNDHAPPPPLLAAPLPSSHPAAAGRRVPPDGADRPRRPAVGRRDGPRHEPGRPRDGRPARDPARDRPPARA